MTTQQTEIKTTTQTITQDPIMNTEVLPGSFTQQIDQTKLVDGQLQPVVTNQIQTSVEGANIQGMTTVQGDTQVLNPIYTKEVKDVKVHDLGTVNLGTVDLGTQHLGTIDLGTKNLGTVDLGTQQLETINLGTQHLGTVDLGTTQLEGEVNAPIYTKEIKETQVHDLGTVDLGTVNFKELPKELMLMVSKLKRY